ncbi:exosortase A [Desulforhopalus sp. 52FAK]
MNTNKINRGKFIILMILWAGAFSPIVPNMVDTWFNHSDNSHALLVPLVSLYFLWEKREQIRSISISDSNAGLWLLAICLIFYVVSFIGGIAFFCRLMMVSSLIAIVWSSLGPQMLRLLAFPLGFLFFMIPIPDTLLNLVSFPLQLLATKISANLIGYCTIPVYREGNMLFFINTQLEVAEACSGIRSIMSLTMLSAIFAHITPGATWRRVVIVLAAIPIAFIANILRITGTGILAHFYGDKVARGFLHDFSGFAVFIFGLIMLFALYAQLKRIGK